MKISLIPNLAVGLLVGVALASPAHAQATRTWVSGVGDDANPCSRTAPCKTFAGAISKTAVNGEINCLDPGGFGAVTITKSITIDCHDMSSASILHSLTTGMIINYDSFAVGDVRRTVNIRNINFQGAATGTNSLRILGAATAGSAVNIEDCLMNGNFGATGRGIDDSRSGGGELNILNTTVRHMAGNGITIAPASGGTTIKATLENVRVYNSNNGLSAGDGTRVMVSRSVFSGNTVGVLTQAGSEVNISKSVSTNNGTGLQQGGGIMRISDSDVTFNVAGVAGTVNSFSNNRFSSNGAGGTITAIAPAGTNPSGMQ